MRPEFFVSSLCVNSKVSATPSASSHVISASTAGCGQNRAQADLVCSRTKPRPANRYATANGDAILNGVLLLNHRTSSSPAGFHGEGVRPVMQKRLLPGDDRPQEVQFIQFTTGEDRGDLFDDRRAKIFLIMTQSFNFILSGKKRATEVALFRSQCHLNLFGD